MTKLEYICFMNLTGYGVAARNYLQALLRENNFDIKLSPLDWNTIRNPETRKHLDPLIKKKKSVDRIQIFHCIPDMCRRFAKNLKTVGVGVYETWKPPAHWVAILNKNDAVIVPSHFNAKEFKDAGVTKPVFHIPHCLDMDVYSPTVTPLKIYDKFTFLFLGSWRERKGYKILLEAWKRFSPADGVQLVIKTDKVSAARETIRHSFRHCSCSPERGLGMAPIIVEDQKFTEAEMPRFIKSFDCLISPTLGEGFGLPGLQSLALGVPIIITNHSGCQDYANPQTAYLLEPDGVRYVKCMDGIPQFSRKEWVYVSPSQVSEKMWEVKTHQEDAKTKGLAGSLYVRERFGYNMVVNGFNEVIHNLL